MNAHPIRCYIATTAKTGLILGQKVWEFSDGTSYLAEDVSIEGTYKIVKGKQIVLAEHPHLVLVVGKEVAPTYHDVDVYLDDVKHTLSNSSYGLRLICTRAGGWELWNTWDGVEEMLGGEFSAKCHFRVVIKGICIVDNIRLIEEEKVRNAVST